MPYYRRKLLINSHQFDILIAYTFWQRTIGFLGRRTLSSDHGLLLTKCNFIHTFGMRFPIDIVFLNDEFQILSITSYLEPWHIKTCRNANNALELSAGMASLLNLHLNESIFDTIVPTKKYTR